MNLLFHLREPWPRDVVKCTDAVNIFTVSSGGATTRTIVRIQQECVHILRILMLLPNQSTRHYFTDFILRLVSVARLGMLNSYKSNRACFTCILIYNNTADAANA